MPNIPRAWLDNVRSLAIQIVVPLVVWLIFIVWHSGTWTTSVESDMTALRDRQTALSTQIQSLSVKLDALTLQVSTYNALQANVNDMRARIDLNDGRISAILAVQNEHQRQIGQLEGELNGVGTDGRH
jgi:peptidoglycan hydrolase CwlO-like protein